jgi:hypothetical protein
VAEKAEIFIYSPPFFAKEACKRNSISLQASFAKTAGW